jgi:hypothetical protein
MCSISRISSSFVAGRVSVSCSASSPCVPLSVPAMSLLCSFAGEVNALYHVPGRKTTVLAGKYPSASSIIPHKRYRSVSDTEYRPEEVL